MRKARFAALAVAVMMLQVCRADEPPWSHQVARFPPGDAATPRLVRLPPPLPIDEADIVYDSMAPPLEPTPFDSLGFDPLVAPSRQGRFSAVGDYFSTVWTDHTNYYARENLTLMGMGFLAAAPLANTPLDRETRDWYQRQVRSDGSDDLARTAKLFGEQWIVVPAYFAALGLGKLTESTPLGGALHEWGDRSIRTMLVGVPPMWLMQVAVGASRPEEDNSYWHPFSDNNGVSGHSFVGAVPFLNAAAMSENPWQRGSFYALSMLPAWSRINDDSHYLSQAILGWWMAYLSVQSVHQTELQRSAFTVSPAYTPDGAGVVFDYRY